MLAYDAVQNVAKVAVLKKIFHALSYIIWTGFKTTCMYNRDNSLFLFYAL